ncbi:unnamed protein product [Phytophthora lilii]|uniref:Unnamed protein product n=1 Tax=Phytophthora lilii TaxID=2077276 RepID=A0A9W6X1K3_9STRA|nr:unnamed protein product [Phytophthora lilii]
MQRRPPCLNEKYKDQHINKSQHMNKVETRSMSPYTVPWHDPFCTPFASCLVSPSNASVYTAQNLFNFGVPSAEVGFTLEGNQQRAKVKAPRLDDAKSGKAHELPLFREDEDVRGVLTVKVDSGKRLEHTGLKLELLGLIEVPLDRNAGYEFTHSVRELQSSGEAIEGEATFTFAFVNVDKPHESYYGRSVRLRYVLRATLARGNYASSLVQEQDLWVQRVAPPPPVDRSIKMEVGIEDCLHIEFEYDKSRNDDQDEVEDLLHSDLDETLGAVDKIKLLTNFHFSIFDSNQRVTQANGIASANGSGHDDCFGCCCGGEGIASESERASVDDSSVEEISSESGNENENVLQCPPPGSEPFPRPDPCHPICGWHVASRREWQKTPCHCHDDPHHCAPRLPLCGGNP